MCVCESNLAQAMDGLSPIWCQAFASTNDDSFLSRAHRTNFSEIRIKILKENALDNIVYQIPAIRWGLNMAVTTWDPFY